jgi:hypothetical protein
MVQELIDLRGSILERRYEDALAIVDELEGMSKQSIIRTIESFLIRLMVHLIKNQVEQRLTNSWAVSLIDSIRQIQKLNLKDNKKSHYIKQDEWLSYLEESLEVAILEASTEVRGGIYKPKQLANLIERDTLIVKAQNLLNLTYLYSSQELLQQTQATLGELPGGDEWFN